MLLLEVKTYSTYTVILTPYHSNDDNGGHDTNDADNNKYNANN